MASPTLAYWLAQYGFIPPLVAPDTALVPADTSLISGARASTSPWSEGGALPSFANDGWECPQILNALEQAEELCFDAVSQIRLQQWHRNRIALVGDAAFCPSLLAGRGSAFGMTGGYILAGELKRAGGDPAIAYPAYQNRLKPFIERKQRQAVGFARQFAPKTRLGLGPQCDEPIAGRSAARRPGGQENVRRPVRAARVQLRGAAYASRR